MSDEYSPIVKAVRDLIQVNDRLARILGTITDDRATDWEWIDDDPDPGEEAPEEQPVGNVRAIGRDAA